MTLGQAADYLKERLDSYHEEGLSKLGELDAQDLADVLPVLNALGAEVSRDLWKRAIRAMEEGYVPAYVDWEPEDEA